MALVSSAVANVLAIPTESSMLFGVPVKTTHLRSKPASWRNFSPKAFAFSNSSAAIVALGELSWNGTTCSGIYRPIYGPIQFH
jgi:hypothetical protein